MNRAIVLAMVMAMAGLFAPLAPTPAAGQASPFSMREASPGDPASESTPATPAPTTAAPTTPSPDASIENSEDAARQASETAQAGAAETEPTATSDTRPLPTEPAQAGETGPASGPAARQQAPQRTQPQRTQRLLRATGPVPFDVDGDGRAEAYVLPSDERAPSRPATTVSPLGGDEPLADVLPIDAVDAVGRRQLGELLRNAAPRVRELRVNVGGATGWSEALIDRPIIPQRILRLDGETGARTLSLYLSAAEASRDATLSFAFTNSVLVLPEASRLRVTLNGRQIAQTAIDSPERTKVVALPVPADLLRTGTNTIRFDAQMHHRIDCSVDATFELWSAFDPRLTGLTFAGSRVLLSGLSDLPAVGVSGSGATRLHVLQASPLEASSMEELLRVTQTAALRGRFERPLIEVGRELAPPSPGLVNVVIGTAGELRRLVPTLADFVAEADVGPYVRLVDTPQVGPTIVLGGPDRRSVSAAIARFAAPLLSLSDAPGTPVSGGPPAKLLGPGETMSLREAGLSTMSFAGRRFSASFDVRLPADFFAAAYGEARLLLDAAYARDVEPGSVLIVRVNGVIATTITFNSLEGEVFDDHPIMLVMDNFRPGENTVEIIAELDTKSDRSCLPGGTVPLADRFVLFSSTELSFANYARIGQVPNLAAFAADAFPYSRMPGPVPLAVAGPSRETVAGAATLLSRLAVASGLPLDVELVDSVASRRNEPLLIVGAIDALSDEVLDATALDMAAPPSWGDSFPAGPTAEPRGLERYDDVLQRLRRQLERGGQGDGALPLSPPQGGFGSPGALSDDPFALPEDDRSMGDDDRWIERLRQERAGGNTLSNLFGGIREAIALDVSLLGGRSNQGGASNAVPESATLVIAQAPAPGNEAHTWTLVTAPDATLLAASVEAMSQSRAWDTLDGRLVSYSLQDGRVTSVPPESVVYVATIPFSLTNWRLIAANWLSIHSGFYAVALCLAALLLGLSTFALLRNARGPR